MWKQTVVGLQTARAAEQSTYIIIKLSHTWMRISALHLNVFVYITDRATCQCLSVRSGLAGNRIRPLKRRQEKSYNVIYS